MGWLNVKANQLSHKSQVIGTDWSLHPKVIKSIWALWGKPHIDLFAMRDSCKLLTFVSTFQDELAWTTDTMSIFSKAVSSNAKGFGQDKRGTGRDHSGCAVVAKKSLVT